MQGYFNNFKYYILLLGTLFSFEIQGYSQAETKFSDTSGEKLLNIGYHKLFISEQGSPSAKFTVVFESGAGGTSQDWTKVIALLPSGIHTVAYDRAGAGRSEQGPLPRTMAQEVFELHKLLNTAKINGSVILVGQSIGGLLVRLYTERYGKNVVALVLVDPAHESSFLGSMKYGGWVRLREKAEGKPIPRPQLIKKISTGYDSTADYMAEEFQKIYLSTLKKPQQLKNRPLIIIGAGIRNQPPGTPDEQWKELRSERDKQIQDLITLSGNSKFILDPKSSHMIQNDNPEIVAKSIQMIINSIESKTKLNIVSGQPYSTYLTINDLLAAGNSQYAAVTRISGTAPAATDEFFAGIHRKAEAGKCILLILAISLIIHLSDPLENEEDGMIWVTDIRYQSRKYDFKIYH